MPIENFRKNLKTALKKKRMKVSELSRKSGVSNVQIYNMMNGNVKYGITAYTLEKIADALGMTMDELYKGDS
ncbi:MAG: helix-turn-helix transcriptional regulator [Bacteroidaceae bacterium]|nr:helix-turn-helix transcriptional regulator [Bacteroidaceae bacterium]